MQKRWFHNKNPLHGRGLTLVECLMASAITAIAVAAIAQAMSSGQMQTADSLHVQRAQSLASALMEEVLSLPQIADGVVSTRNGTRTHLTSFHGFSETAGALKDASNGVYPTLFQKFSRSVSVTSGSLTLPGCQPTNGWTVVVTVSEPHGRQWTVTRFVPAS